MKNPMQIFGLPTKLIRTGDNLADVILDAANGQGLEIEDKDLLAIASKALAVSEKRLVELSSIKPSRRAMRLAKKYELEPNFVEVVLQEAEKAYGGATKTLLTLKNNMLVANAGVDRKNAPEGHVILWPLNPHESAERIRREILTKTGRQVGVLIVDSGISPLRMGTTALAIGVAGFKPIKDCRVERDVYGKRIHITRHALADDLASAAHLVMGETTARIPAVLIKNAPVILSEECDPNSMTIPAEQCLFMESFLGKA
ncbi:MAG: coenzyme F420-0:L-glutamate ligase [Candidatus Bathyarchaeota archaeon]|nr:MAG: coenzyme F420-0:L-glutamate ligase [Candidatus Bathyarchaeota archaeon]